MVRILDSLPVVWLDNGGIDVIGFLVCLGGFISSFGGVEIFPALVLLTVYSLSSIQCVQILFLLIFGNILTHWLICPYW